MRFGRPTTPPDTVVAHDQEWISLGEASRMLGVSPGTLRRWSDGGRVDTFTTVGGHRQFRRSALERMLPPERPIGAVLVRAILDPVRLRRAYRTEARTATRQAGWLLDLDEEKRLWFRDQGRRLVEQLLAHLDAQDPEIARHHLAEATSIASAYGRTTSAMGAGLSDALEAFLRFRRPFLDELSGVLQRRGAEPATATAIGRAADQAMDALVIAAMAAHSVERVAATRRPHPIRTRRVGAEADLPERTGG